MKFNPAQQNACNILDDLTSSINRALVQKGAAAFHQVDYYNHWRDWCNNHISEQLVRIYGSHVLEDDSDNCWQWQIMPEHANLCHNLPEVSLAMLRIQQRQPTDLVIVRLSDNHRIIAALGAGCLSHNGRARVSKLREPAKYMLYAGEQLPGNLRTIGSPLLEIAMVANGMLDAGCWNEVGGFLAMAGKLLLSEAGGLATDKNGNALEFGIKRGSLLLANPKLHARLSPIVRELSSA